MSQRQGSRGAPARQGHPYANGRSNRRYTPEASLGQQQPSNGGASSTPASARGRGGHHQVPPRQGRQNQGVPPTRIPVISLDDEDDDVIIEDVRGTAQSPGRLSLSLQAQGGALVSPTLRPPSSGPPISSAISSSNAGASSPSSPQTNGASTSSQSPPNPIVSPPTSSSAGGQRSGTSSGPAFPPSAVAASASVHPPNSSVAIAPPSAGSRVQGTSSGVGQASGVVGSGVAPGAANGIVDQYAVNLPRHLSEVEILQRSLEVQDGRIPRMLPVGGVFVMALRATDCVTALDTLAATTRIDRTRWHNAGQTRRSIFNSRLQVFTIVYRVDIVSPRCLPFNATTSPWKSFFSSLSLSNPSCLFWHAMSDGDILRLCLLATWLESSRTRYGAFYKDWRRAVGRREDLITAFGIRDVRKKVEALLCPYGKDQLMDEMRQIGWDGDDDAQ